MVRTGRPERSQAGGSRTARDPAAPAVLRYDNMLAGVLPEGGIDPSRMAPDGDLSRRFERAVEVVQARRENGDLGFLNLPGDDALAARTRQVAARAGRTAPSDLVVIGIGGSALGAAALRCALLPPGWNEHGEDFRRGLPRLHVLDNPDPDSVRSLLARLEPHRTVVNVASKSGSTAETLALFLVVVAWLEDALGEEGAAARVIVTTNPERGFLRGLARERSLASLPVPPGVGGRFSVLSPVGLLPAFMTGMDVDALLAGAAGMAARCASGELRSNPAGVLATLLHAAHVETGARIHVFMPYADRLRRFALWQQQLWAESLGKARRVDGGPARAGPTPLPALGAVDQHSLLQLLMEGPPDKVVVFLASERPAADVAVPGPSGRLAAGAADAVRHLGGRTLHELLACERVATAEALRRAGRPSMTVAVDRVDARAAGGLFMLMQMAVVLAGALYRVDPMDQPGVELGKTLTHGLLGRAGAARPLIPAPDPRWRV